MPFDFDLENIKDSLDRIKLDSLLPDLSNFESSVLSITRLAKGSWLLKLPPAEESPCSDDSLGLGEFSE